MNRRWCVALLLAIALGAVAMVVRDPSASGRDSRRALERGRHVSLAEVSRDVGVDLVMPARRVVSEGTVKPLLQTFAMLGVACVLALAASLRAGRSTRPSSTRAPRRVPCGSRAPPALRVV